MYNSDEVDREENNFCFVVKNIDSKVVRDKLWEVFSDFGTVTQVEMNTEIWAAAVIYALKPLDQIYTLPIYLYDRLLSIKRIPFQDYLRLEICPVPVTKLSFGGLATPVVFVEEWMTQEFVSFDLNLNQSYIDIFFAHVDSYYRFRIEYNEKDFRKSILLQRNDNISSVIISGKYPAKFWKSKIPMQHLKSTYELTDWERVIEIPLDDFSRDIMRNKHAASSKAPVVPGGRFPNHTINLSNWTVYRLEFDVPLKSSKMAAKIPLCPENLTHEALEKKINKATSVVTNATPEIRVSRPTKKINLEDCSSGMSFEVQYMIEHVFNLKVLREYNVEVEFFKKMQLLPPQVATSFLTLLAAPQQRVYNPDTVISYVYTISKEHVGYQQTIPDGFFLLRKVLVTPTSIYPLQPTVERMNHLQFHFRQHIDRFLQVQFTDEDLSPVESTLPPDNNEHSLSANVQIYDRIYETLRKGIQVARRHFEFLGSSVDDIRDHQCWFFAPTETLSRADLLNWMGDFREINKVATFVSCVGRELLPRLTEIELKVDEVEEIDDVEKAGYSFTNDCGKMSPQIAREIGSALGLNYTPCAVRFNLAGSSGMLMLSNYLQKRKIQLHSSQIKYNSPRLTLEIVKVAKPNKVFLDRRSITMLSSLGIRDYVFHDLLSTTMTQYTKNMFPKDEVDYSLMCEYYSDGRMDNFQSVIDAEFLKRNDPFINNLASAYQNSQLEAIQKEAKLYIHDGVKVFACIDETGTLAAGEVFIQTIHRSGSTSMRQAIEGPCLIYRENSCFPGDYRVVQSVNKEKLRHLTNVLVYSMYDALDLPSSCSHDDSDLDNFTVIWDARLVLAKKNQPGRTYKPEITANNLNKIAFKEIAKFFTTYISKDRMDILNKAFIAISDRHKEGILHGDCIYLSQQLSRALDFAKTGVYATIYSEFHHYPFPDFMGENMLKTYASKKPIGQLYNVSAQLSPKHFITSRCIYDTRLYLDNMYEFIAEARKSKARYDHSLRILIGQYSVQSEIELISGHIMTWPKYLSLKDKPGFAKRMRKAYIRLKNEWIELFELEFINYQGEDIREKMRAKAAAWYYVTYHRSEFKSDVNYNSAMTRYMSFPWVVDDYLTYIAEMNTNRPAKDYYLQPVSAEKINSVAKNTNILFLSDDEDDEEETDSKDDTDEDGDTENETDINQGSPIPENDPIPVLSVKLSDLLKE